MPRAGFVVVSVPLVPCVALACVACVQSGRSQEAIALFDRMCHASDPNIRANPSALTSSLNSAINACNIAGRCVCRVSCRAKRAPCTYAVRTGAKGCAGTCAMSCSALSCGVCLALDDTDGRHELVDSPGARAPQQRTRGVRGHGPSLSHTSDRPPDLDLRAAPSTHIMMCTLPGVI